MGPDQAVSKGRVARALVEGAVCGSGLTAIGLEILTHTPGEPFLLAAALYWPLAGMAWALGLTFVGGPAWLILHRCGLRSWRTALIAGVVLSFAGCCVLNIHYGIRAEPIQGFEELWPELSVSLIGGIVGLLIWRVAYDRVASELES